MNKIHFKVFIPSAGIGSRLGELTKFRNKALMDVGNKPVISRIISSYPSNTKFVIALGYLGNMIKDYIDIAHPYLDVFYIDINPYDGPHSSLGVTLEQSRKHLQAPFIFHACDTLIKSQLEFLDDNWIGVGECVNPENYRLIENQQVNITQISMEKGIGDKSKAYIGMAGIKNYKMFWNYFDNDKKNSLKIGEIIGLNGILKNHKFKLMQYEWGDTGNVEILKSLQNEFKDNNIKILPKLDESIWFTNNNCIKFFYNKEIVKERTKRATILKNFVPKIKESKNNFYSYNFVAGKPISHVLNIENFKSLLDYSLFFWEKIDLSNDKQKDFYNICIQFYKNKTEDRLNDFYKKFGNVDKSIDINNNLIPSLKSSLETLDWEYISLGDPVRFHGDFHLENIILKDNSKNEFVFLDWRQNFGGIFNYGDIYYDLAKMLHSLYVPHSAIDCGDYEIKLSENKIEYFIKKDSIYIDCENFFFAWCEKNQFDIKKIKIICALIFLNISPLHHFPYSIFLNTIGRDILDKAVIQK